MREELIQVMSRIPSHALAVFIFLESRSQQDTKIGLTQQEVGRATRLSVEAVRESLGWLESPTTRDANLTVQSELAPFIRIVKFSGAHKVFVLPPYTEQERQIRFTFEDFDQRRIKTLEDEVRRLSIYRVQSSKLSLYLKGDRQHLIAEIEGDVGRPLTSEECYLLGGMTHLYGVDRIKAAWRKNAADMERPIVGIYAMLLNKTWGKSVVDTKEKEEAIDRDSYRRIPKDDEII